MPKRKYRFEIVTNVGGRHAGVRTGCAYRAEMFFAEKERHSSILEKEPEEPKRRNRDLEPFTQRSFTRFGKHFLVLRRRTIVTRTTIQTEDTNEKSISKMYPHRAGWPEKDLKRHRASNFWYITRKMIFDKEHYDSKR